MKKPKFLKKLTDIRYKFKNNLLLIIKLFSFVLMAAAGAYVIGDFRDILAYIVFLCFIYFFSLKETMIVSLLMLLVTLVFFLMGEQEFYVEVGDFVFVLFAAAAFRVIGDLLDTRSDKLG
jgi:hypothetical protein